MVCIMTDQAVLWILGIAVTILSPMVLFLANWCHKLADRQTKMADDFANFKAEVPVRYANDADIRRVEEAIGGMRHDLTALATEVRTNVATLAATLNQLVGANAHRG